MSVPVVGDKVMVLADVGILMKRQRYLWKDPMRNVSTFIVEFAFLLISWLYLL